MEELKHPWLTGQSTPAPVLILNLDASLLGTYHQIGQQLRKAGIGAEVYPEAKKLGQQFQYAEKRGHRVAVIVGAEEAAKGIVKLKNLAARSESTAAIDDSLAMSIQSLLAGS